MNLVCGRGVVLHSGYLRSVSFCLTPSTLCSVTLNGKIFQVFHLVQREPLNIIFVTVHIHMYICVCVGESYIVSYVEKAKQWP